MEQVNKLMGDKFINWLSVYGPRILLAIILLIAGQWLIKLLVKWFNGFLQKRNLNQTIKPFLLNLVKFALQVVLLVIIMQLLGVKMTLFAAVIGALGVAAGLALSGTLQNFASGVLIILLHPFRVGDNIKTQGEEGTVTGIKLFYTTIVTYNNNTLIVPNGKLSNEIIYNLTLNKTRRYDLTLKIKSDMDFYLLREKIIAAIKTSNGVLNDPPVRIGIKDIELDSYTLAINIWLDAHGFEDNKMLINEAVWKEISGKES